MPAWTISVKHASSSAAPEDGVRVLVDRRGPPGLRREQVNADLWLKDIAPSDELLRWRGSRQGWWEGFDARYRAEIRRNAETLLVLEELHARGPLTLLHCLRDAEFNNAVVLRQVLRERERSLQES